jgi:hypothetical protein
MSGFMPSHAQGYEPNELEGQVYASVANPHFDCEPDLFYRQRLNISRYQRSSLSHCLNGISSSIVVVVRPSGGAGVENQTP